MQKNQSSSAGKKKKKKSKAELEAERLEKERVEAEVEAERERVLEEERKKAEAKAEELRQDLKAKRKNEVQLLVTEYEDEIASYEENQARLKELTSKADKEKDWERFISCSTLPFVQSVPEINTYLSEQYESLLLEEDDTSIVTRLLSWIATNQYICQALLAHSAESATKSEEKNNLVCALYDASNAQIDKACSYVIQHADNSYARDESSKPNHSAKSEFFFQTRDLDAFCHLPSKGKNDGFLSTKDDKRDNTIMQHPSSSMIKSNQRKTQIRTQTTSDSDALTSSSPMSTPGKGGKRTPSKYFNSSHMFSSTLHGATEQNFNTNENTLSIFRVDTDTIPEGAPRNNFEKAIRGEIRIGVWANLVARSVRGPFKQLSFTDIDLGLDLPKSLGTQRIGARIVFFPYEHIPKIYRSLSPLNNLDRKLEPFEDDDEFDAALLPSERMLILATIQIEIFELPRKPVQLRPKLMFRQLTSAEQQGTVKLIHFPPGAEIGKDRIPLVAAAPSLNQFLRAKLKPPKKFIHS
uniref:IC97/Casc1 N-terminal domain-containing protein n=1 Tax=Aureoumbra lagunensis TaxID=44058 RepID=A0A7S3K6D8_9STRA